MMGLNDIKKSLSTGRYDEAYHELKLLEQPDFEARVLEAITLVGIQQLKQAENLVIQLQQSATSPRERELVQVAQVNLKYRQGDFETSLSLIDDLEISNMPRDYWKQTITNLHAKCHHVMGDFEQAKDHYEATLKIQQELEMPLGESYLNLGEVYLDLEDLNLAEEYLDKANTIAKKNHNDQIVGYSCLNIGSIAHTRGDFEQALQYFYESMEIFTAIQWLSGQVLAGTRISRTLIYQGKFDKASQVLHSILNQANELESSYYKGLILNNLSALSFSEGKIDKGIDFKEESFDIFRAIGNNSELIKAMFDLIVELTNVGWDRDMILTYMNEFRELTNSSELQGEKSKGRFVEALHNKMNSRLTDKVQAQNIFEDLLANDYHDTNFRILCLLNLVEIKLFELKIFENTEIESEIKDLLDEIENLAKKEKRLPLQIEILLIRSNLSLILQNYEMLSLYLEDAAQLALKCNTPAINQKVKQMRDNITSEQKRWDNLVNNFPKLKDRIEQSKILDYLNDVSRVLRER